MIALRYILWRLALTMVALVFLASCGIEQSAPTPAPPTQPISTASPPSATTPPRTAPPTPLSSSTVPSQSPTLTPTLSNQPRPARLTVTLADEGTTITLQVGDRFLLDLGAQFTWEVTIADTSILNHVANTGGKDNQGLYEALKVGRTTLTATGTPLCYNAVPRCLMPSRLFTLHVNVAGGGGPALTITMADNGKTIPLAVGQRFLLSLAQDYDWTLTVDNPAIVNRVADTTIVKGAQAVYEAKKAGSTTLRATGGVICPPGKACILIALEFRVQLTVK